MADGISGRLEMYLLTPVPESQNSSGYELFRLPVPPKQLDGYLKRLDPKAKIVPDLTTLQHKIVKIIKQHLQRENLGLGVVQLVEQRVHSANDASICPPVNVVYVVLRPASKDDDRMRQHQIETIPSGNVANAAATLSTTYVRIVEIMPNEGNAEDLQAEAEPQVGFTDQSIPPIVTHKKKQKRRKKGKPAEGAGPSEHNRALSTGHEQKEDDDKDEQTQDGADFSATSADAGASAEDSTAESATDALARFLESLRAAAPARSYEVESTNSTSHSPTPPSDAPTAVMIPFTPTASAFVRSEPASSESAVQGNPVKGHTKVLRHCATAQLHSRKILSRSSTTNPPTTITTGSHVPLTLVDSPRSLLSARDTVSLQPPIHSPSTNPTAVPPTASTRGHLRLCSECTRTAATGTTTTPSISVPPTASQSPPPVQQPSTAPAPSFAYSFDPQNFDFEFKHGKDKR